ncbi:MAG: hypothetical protein WC734_03995 [Patescibacteria group bacterium]
MNPTKYIIEHCQTKLESNEAPVWFLAVWSIFEAKAFAGNFVKTRELQNHTANLDNTFVNLGSAVWPTIKNELRGIQNNYIQLQTAAGFDLLTFPSDFITNGCQNNAHILIAAIYQLRNKLAHGQLYPSANYSDEGSLFVQITNIIQLAGTVCLKWVCLAE